MGDQFSPEEAADYVNKCMGRGDFENAVRCIMDYSTIYEFTPFVQGTFDPELSHYSSYLAQYGLQPPVIEEVYKYLKSREKINQEYAYELAITRTNLGSNAMNLYFSLRESGFSRDVCYPVVQQLSLKQNYDLNAALALANAYVRQQG